LSVKRIKLCFFLIQVFDYGYIVYTYFTHIAASSAATDVFTN